MVAVDVVDPSTNQERVRWKPGNEDEVQNRKGIARSCYDLKFMLFTIMMSNWMLVQACTVLLTFEYNGAVDL